MKGRQNIKRYLGLGVVVLLLGCVHSATPKARQGPLTNTERRKFLMAHNKFRSNPKEFDGVKQPSAANMKRIYWNSGLEAEAAAWTAIQAKKNKMGHGTSEVQKRKEFWRILNASSISSLGQNSMVGTSDVALAVSEWHREGSNYKTSTKTCAKSMCDHYTQVVWADTKYLGCSFANKEGKDPFLNCDYYPPGNWPGVNPYKAGKPCSLCSAYKADGFTECEDGLCQPKDKCSPVTECKVVDTVHCLCSEEDYSGIVKRLVKGTGLRLAPPSLLLSVVVVDLLVSSH